VLEPRPGQPSAKSPGIHYFPSPINKKAGPLLTLLGIAALAVPLLAFRPIYVTQSNVSMILRYNLLNLIGF
jgi:hypothetical protein